MMKQIFLLYWLLSAIVSLQAQDFNIVIVPTEYSLEKDINHTYLGMHNPIFLDFDADLDSFSFQTNNGKIITTVNIIREYFVVPEKLGQVTITATAFFSNRQVKTKSRTFFVIPPPNLGLQVRNNKVFTTGIITFNLIDNTKKIIVDKSYVVGAFEVEIYRGTNLILRGAFSGSLLVNISKLENGTKAMPGDILKIKQVRLLDIEKNIPAFTQPFELKL